MPLTLGDLFDPSMHTQSNLMALNSKMQEILDREGRKDPEEALGWWKRLDAISSSELRVQKLYQAPLFSDASRAYFCIQASPAASIDRAGDMVHEQLEAIVSK